ncbi:MAG: hypothetical protein JSW64_05755 [Candidatus Zixiibacteriota bacterium]|nr:MAG: hypothetical protein JSW64_05755 [candidate division Zixibacteria bacterium]
MPHKSPFGAYELPPEEEALTDEEKEILFKLADFVVRKGLTVPAILSLETVKPLNYIGSQAMVFLEPFVQALFRDISKYNTFRRMMEKRDNVERLLQKIEELDAIQFQKEKELKKKYKAEKKARWAKRKRFLRKLFGRERAEDSSRISREDRKE